MSIYESKNRYYMDNIFEAYKWTFEEFFAGYSIDELIADNRFPLNSACCIKVRGFFFFMKALFENNLLSIIVYFWKFKYRTT